MFDRMLEFSLNHPILVGAFIAILIALIIYENTKGSGAINCQDAIMAVNRNTATIFDIRNVVSFKNGHIASSVSLPIETLDTRAKSKTLEKYKNKQIIVVCNSGTAAGSAVQKLKTLGFENAVKLKGGIAAWQNENLPLVKGKA